ncbi:hypothetical protein [Desulfitobacterium hafniense]|uniref:Prokaryotic membrane lipoprotein lipid attachment site profile n=3 Tax=Desulfitobacterium hafniense TaxID=49338 RepID=Q24TK4_DESHY|nr:hypothetical protein [Desulfitobacterium hafniense]KTE89981.1 hypothetical protein AT727_08615 [Desulfitobacterium hafniense]BAE84638.1 hypothetical protein DSY2849 [Desulfitobacterium hafniense Y51]
MKKVMILTASALALSLALVGCSNVEVSIEEKDQNTLSVESVQLERKIIIRNSIADPLPAEAQKALSLPDKGGPQQLPNVDLSTPIIITKMPYPERNKP